MSDVSSRCTIAANTFSRGKPCLRMWPLMRVADSGQRLCEVGRAVELRRLLVFAEAWVIAMLFAPARVAAGGLQVPVLVWR